MTRGNPVILIPWPASFMKLQNYWQNIYLFSAHDSDGNDRIQFVLRILCGDLQECSTFLGFFPSLKTKYFAKQF